MFRRLLILNKLIYGEFILFSINKNHLYQIKFFLVYIMSNDDINDYVPSNELFVFSSEEYAENYKKINLDLFFSLLQVTDEIKFQTNKDNIYLLIGDSPSYLKPMLETYATTINIPFSGAGYGCFYDYNYYKNIEEWKTKHKYSDMPKEEHLNGFFKFLEMETLLTREFVKNNWNKIILIDGSERGVTPMAFSMILNKPIKTIYINSDCWNFNEYNSAEPLKFINIANHPFLMHRTAKYKGQFDVNLIIKFMDIRFCHIGYFLVNFIQGIYLHILKRIGLIHLMMQIINLNIMKD